MYGMGCTHTDIHTLLENLNTSTITIIITFPSETSSIASIILIIISITMNQGASERERDESVKEYEFFSAGVATAEDIQKKSTAAWYDYPIHSFAGNNVIVSTLSYNRKGRRIRGLKSCNATPLTIQVSTSTTSIRRP